MAAAASYEALFNGRLQGLLQWQQFEALWARLRASPQGWYVRDFQAATIPDSPLPGERFIRFLDDSEDFLRRRHREAYCGFIYVDDVAEPAFIKVFDPRRMGSACGCGGEVKPRWTISRMKPLLAADMAMADAGEERGGWLARLLKRQGG